MEKGKSYKLQRNFIITSGEKIFSIILACRLSKWSFDHKIFSNSRLVLLVNNIFVIKTVISRYVAAKEDVYIGVL